MVNLYIASKVSAVPEWLPHANLCPQLVICSRWHTLGPLDDTDPFACLKLWDSMILPDLEKADALLLYSREGDVLRGAMAEVGAVWSRRKPVVMVGPVADAMRTLCHSAWVHRADTFEGAYEAILKLCAPN